MKLEYEQRKRLVEHNIKIKGWKDAFFGDNDAAPEFIGFTLVHTQTHQTCGLVNPATLEFEPWSVADVAADRYQPIVQCTNMDEVIDAVIIQATLNRMEI